MMLSRRGLLPFIAAAPAIVRFASLMPVKTQLLLPEGLTVEKLLAAQAALNATDPPAFLIPDRYLEGLARVLARDSDRAMLEGLLPTR